MMLYEMLARRLPFDADTAAAVMAQVATAKPPPLGLLRPDAPEALAALVHACLEKDVNNRIQNVAALAEGLGPFVPEEYQPLVRRVARTREAPGGKAATPALAFRRVLAAAETVERAADPNAAAPADKAAPKTLVAEKAAPKVPVAEEAPPTPPVAASSIAPPAGPDYPRRTFAVAVYVAVLATAAVLVALLRPAAAPTASVVQAAQTAAAGPTALASPPRPAASESATLPSAALSAEPSATASTAASAVTSARPRPSPSTTSTRRLPDDFVVQP